MGKGYLKLDELYGSMKALSSQNSSILKLDTLGRSQGGNPIYVFVVGGSENDGKFYPSIFVGANFEGYRVDGTYMVINLLERVLSDYKSGKLKNFLTHHKIYFAPLLNPDVYENYFSGVEKLTNNFPVNDDLDEVVDEDSPEDLNGDGFITMMRVKDEDGKWIVDEKDPRIMKKADAKKGEVGIYKLYTEGIDNDGDGRINEDAKGGVLLSKNFPQKFPYFEKDTGIYPASQPEVREFIDYLLKKRDISFVFLFGSENMLTTNIPFNKGNLGGERVKVPERFARYLGLDPQREYTLNEIVKIIKESGFGRGRDITPEKVAQFFGFSTPTNITPTDKKFYDELKKEYEKIVKEEKREKKFPTGGSPAIWCYFQYGVYTVEDDIWSIPENLGKGKKKGVLSPDNLKKMNGEDFLKLEDSKINDELKKIGAPSFVNAKMLKEAVKSGRLTPKKIGEMIKKFKNKKSAEGGFKKLEEKYKLYEKYYGNDFFIPWKTFKHPTLGEVEIGGLKPFVGKVPPFNLVKERVDGEYKFFTGLLGKFKDVEISKVKVEKKADGIFKISCYVKNNCDLPIFTDFASKFSVVNPISVQLLTDNGIKIISGKPLQKITQIEPHNQKKVKWLISGKEGSEITLRLYWDRWGEIVKKVLLKEE